ncbi:MAG: hypothetical protein OXJ62_17230 [Spirochaetaceae bacterium]|nr:hypothetical protein [Spirochaetaceae bacterium]
MYHQPSTLYDLGGFVIDVPQPTLLLPYEQRRITDLDSFNALFLWRDYLAGDGKGWQRLV